MQEKAIEEPLETVSEVTKTRKPLSWSGLVWLRLKKMPRFWIGITVVVAIILWVFVGPLVYLVVDHQPGPAQHGHGLRP